MQFGCRPCRVEAKSMAPIQQTLESNFNWKPENNSTYFLGEYRSDLNAQTEQKGLKSIDGRYDVAAIQLYIYYLQVSRMLDLAGSVFSQTLDLPFVGSLGIHDG